MWCSGVSSDGTEVDPSRYLCAMQAMETDLGEVLVLEPTVHGDDRGFFFEAWNRRTFVNVTGVAADFVQDNHSKSAFGVVRGLHYQYPSAQAKLVRCGVGAVWDVVVDIRASSPEFGRWFGIELTADNKRQLWIPQGYAHGFVALTDGAELLYKATEYYHQASDRVIAWDDPEIDIAWPLPDDPVLSERDRAAPALRDAVLFP